MRRQNIRGLLLIMVAIALLFALPATADPSGAQITSSSTDTGPTISPEGHTANRSTITTIALNAVQQDQRWKAYIGNVSGTLTLDDASNKTIYDWSTAAISGEVFSSTSGSLDFSTVSCASSGVIGTAETAMAQAGTEVDSISSTFNSTDHSSTVVAGTSLSNCNSTTLYVNDVSQGQDSGADFQEFLMQETTNSLVYVSILNDNTVGFDGNTYDFQMIVPETPTGAAHTYYFYVELGT